jgi:hypothetical protein
VAGTDRLGSASEVGLNEVEDRAHDSETGVKSGWEDAMVNHVKGSTEVYVEKSGWLAFIRGSKNAIQGDQ